MALKHHAATQFFFDFQAARGGCAPTTPGGRPFCEQTTHPREPDFSSVPRLGFEHDSGRFVHALSKQCQPAPERGRGGFRMGRTQPHGIAEHHRTALAPNFGFHPACVEWLFRASRPKRHQPAPRRAAHGAKSFAGPFHTKLWREHDFGGTFPRFGSRFLWSGRAVWIGVRPCARPGTGSKGLTEGGGGFRMLTDARFCSFDALLFFQFVT